MRVRYIVVLLFIIVKIYDGVTRPFCMHHKSTEVCGNRVNSLEVLYDIVLRNYVHVKKFHGSEFTSS